jgi:methylmalonyl-CoA/ethylmalonyl-CoA epimerase
MQSAIGSRGTGPESFSRTQCRFSIAAGRNSRFLKETIMSRIRHIAIIVPDAEEAAKFYEQAFGLKRAGKARRGVYLSDGIINVALLTRERDDEPLGLYHFGIWVDDLDAAEKKVVEAGGSYLAGRPTSPNSFYEAKYKDPNGVVFDLTHNGWAGAAKDAVAKT